MSVLWFVGNKVWNSPAFFWVECTNCGAATASKSVRYEALDAWDRRAIDKELVERVVELARGFTWRDEDGADFDYTAGEIIAELEKA